MYVSPGWEYILSNPVTGCVALSWLQVGLWGAVTKIMKVGIALKEGAVLDLWDIFLHVHN